MSITEFANFLQFADKLYGGITIHPGQQGENSIIKLQNMKYEEVGWFMIKHGEVSNVWLRYDNLSSEKKKEAKEQLQSDRFTNIMT